VNKETPCGIGRRALFVKRGEFAKFHVSPGKNDFGHIVLLNGKKSPVQEFTLSLLCNSVIVYQGTGKYLILFDSVIPSLFMVK
jgi:hypothetical protein